MRRSGVLAVAAAAAIIVSACSGGSTPSPSQAAAASPSPAASQAAASQAAQPSAAGGEAVTIKVLNWAPGGPDYWKALVDAFQTLHPNITVQLETIPFEKYFESEGPYIASRSGPDVMGNNVALELFERKEAYLPINDRLTPDITADLISYKGACEEFDPSKPCYGLPFGYQGNVMYYNRQVLTAAGLDPDNPPQTWDDFGKACDAIKKIGKACVAMGVTGVFPAYWVFPEIAKNYWTSEQDIVSFFHGKIPWTDPRLTNSLTKMAEMAKNGWFQDGAAAAAMIPDGADVFTRGDAGFAGTIISDAVNWKAFGDILGQENLGVMRWPAIVPDAPLVKKFSGVEAAMWGVTSWSPHPNEAWEFVKFLATKQNADLFIKISGSQPINKSFDKSLVPTSPSFEKIQEIIADPTLHSGVMMSGRETDALSRGFAQIVNGEITVDDWVKAMQTALEASNKQ